MKYHEKLRFLNKSYFNKIYIVLVLSFTYMAFDIFICSCVNKYLKLLWSMFFCFIVRISWSVTQICTVNSVFHYRFWGYFIIYLKCKCNTETNTMETMIYFLQKKSTKSQYINQTQKHIDKKLTSVFSMSGKRISGKVNSH